MVKLVSLDEYKKENSDNAADWGVVDALKRTIELVESGEFAADMMVICLARTGDGGMLDRYRVLRVDSHLEALGLLTQSAHDLLVSGSISDEEEDD